MTKIDIPLLEILKLCKKVYLFLGNNQIGNKGLKILL